MIRNERQYWTAKSQAERLQQILSEPVGGDCKDSDVHPLIAKARQDATRSQLQDLEADLEEYEDLKAGKFDLSALMVVIGLPEMLIKARIARGMTQRELAERVGLKEQQVQRYEATEYAGASLSRIRDVVGGLLVNDTRVTLPDTGTDKWFYSLKAAFRMFEEQKDYFRFEVRPKASIYVRRSELRRGERVARINLEYIHNFPKSDELQRYINENDIGTDDSRGDYKIGPEHIGPVIAILTR